MRRAWSMALCCVLVACAAAGTAGNGRDKPRRQARPERIRAVNVCFGAWLYGERANRAHALEIEEVALGR